MTPEELARMQAGVDPRAYYGDQESIRRKVLAGELPEEMLPGKGATTIRPGTTGSKSFNPSDFFENMMNRMGGFTKNIDQPGGLLKNQQGQYRRAGGGKLSAGLGALETTLQDPVAGIVSAPIGIAGGQLANMATNALTQGMMQGPVPLKAAGMALRYLVPSVAGYQAQKMAAGGVQNLMGTAPQAVGGAAQAATGGLFGLGSSFQDLVIKDVPFFGTINVGERAKRGAEAAYQRKQLTEDLNLQLQFDEKRASLNRMNELEFLKAQGQMNRENMILQTKALAPIIADAQRRELAGQQTLMNTQIAGMKSLGRMAGSFDLAGRSMAESGALARTLAANSPYNAAMLPMPQIQFGG
jgi:hypothetical protein